MLPLPNSSSLNSESALPSTGVRADFTVDQNWESYSDEDHAIWRELFERQAALLPGRVVPEFLEGLDFLSVAADGIPDFARLNELLKDATGWTIVAVPGLVPDEVFFDHLANRRFPATHWIRDRAQLDYLEEPDLFHDVFGHVPLLANPVFADYMQAYGKGGLRASGKGALQYLARLYWYTVEFGLIETREGLRIYGAGIVSSKSESIFALESPSPNRIGFDLERVMSTLYRIDDFQETYFVIKSFQSLFNATAQDFAPIYKELDRRPDFDPGVILESDRVIFRGNGSYHR
ncbi:phenylalanine 4-monooxygenase [Denitrobaculum tricleocarpae]|uniref:Phenylalanine-4-hydroxylase n=1 Tax=Denitrobaculum tricleocarpae TaxID=2591009 RepID=A0A545TUC9_9PROT|nr:phenylalanine 4-monooxygenase [Denitrobaculum tricleocarpae]TQV80828.1 phenylalanine 4-monooxygenase [Denitrobaculum tricleocarpae]